MALITGFNVATGMTDIAEPVLYSNSWLMDGVTFTSKYQRDSMGKYQIPKYAGSGYKKPAATSGKFVGTAYQNTLITINLNNVFQDEADVYGVQASSVNYDILGDAVINKTEEARRNREGAALAVLVAQATDLGDTTAVTSSNVKEIVLAARKKIRKKHGYANVCVCSVDFYSAILEHAGKDFTPLSNDTTNATGKIGSWLGILFIEASALDNESTYSYVNDSDVVVDVDMASVDFVMYDFNAFSVLDLLNTVRAINTEEFVGSKVQYEIVSGMKITNADCAVVKKKI